MYARWSVISMPSGSKLSSWQKETGSKLQGSHWRKKLRNIQPFDLKHYISVEFANRSRIDPIELGDRFDRLTHPARSISESPTVFKWEAVLPIK